MDAKRTKPTPTALTSSSGWVDDNVKSISIRIARAEFLSNPPVLQAQRRERVRRLLAQEAERGQKSPSYLMQHAKEIYGV